MEGPENRYRQAFGEYHPRFRGIKNFRIFGDQSNSSLSPAQQDTHRRIQNAQRFERERGDKHYKRAFYTGFQEPVRQAPVENAKSRFEQSYPRQRQATAQQAAPSLKRTFLEATARTNSPAHRFHLHEQCTIAPPENPSRFYRGDGTGTYDLAGMARMPYRDINEAYQQPKKLKRRDNDTMDRSKSPKNRRGYQSNLNQSNPRQSDGQEIDIDAEIKRIERSI